MWYDGGVWTSRQTWCLDCLPEEIDPGTDGADEMIFVGVFLLIDWRQYILSNINDLIE